MPSETSAAAPSSSAPTMVHTQTTTVPRSPHTRQKTDPPNEDIPMKTIRPSTNVEEAAEATINLASDLAGDEENSGDEESSEDETEAASDSGATLPDPSGSRHTTVAHAGERRPGSAPKISISDVNYLIFVHSLGFLAVSWTVSSSLGIRLMFGLCMAFSLISYMIEAFRADPEEGEGGFWRKVYRVASATLTVLATTLFLVGVFLLIRDCQSYSSPGQSPQIVPLRIKRLENEVKRTDFKLPVCRRD